MEILPHTQKLIKQISEEITRCIHHGIYFDRIIESKGKNHIKQSDLTWIHQGSSRRKLGGSPPWLQNDNNNGE